LHPPLWVPVADPRSFMPPPRRDRTPRALPSGPVWTALVTALIAGAAWLGWSRFTDTPSAAPALSPADSMQQSLLHENLGRAGDADLDAKFASINAAHFGGALPAIPVRWEPKLAAVGALANHAFTLEGMFGHIGTKTLILLNPSLRDDAAALDRALCHEMVHASLYVAGIDSVDHGPAFQAVLHRLSNEGAFEGILASDDEREQLHAWLDAESERLDAEHDEMDQIGREITDERDAIERAQAALDAAAKDGHPPSDADVAALSASRDAYNARAIDTNARLDRDRADLDHFNAEVERYNLMLLYPDGMDESARVLPKAAR
jgi:hypothetical protein